MKSRPILAGLCALSLAAASWAQAEDSAPEGQNTAPAVVAAPAPAAAPTEPAATPPAPNTGALAMPPAPTAEPAKQASPTPPVPAADEAAGKSGVSEISRRRIRETRRKLDELLWH